MPYGDKNHGIPEETYKNKKIMDNHIRNVYALAAITAKTKI